MSVSTAVHRSGSTECVPTERLPTERMPTVRPSTECASIERASTDYAPGLFETAPHRVQRRSAPASAAPRPAPASSTVRSTGASSSTAPGHGRAVPPIPQAARDLLADASRGLGRAMRAGTSSDRYAAAHLAALRAAAAVLAARATPVRGRRGSAWELISKVAPEFSEWAAFFAAGSAKRQAAEAGLHRLVTPREADDMVRQVATFLDLVEESLAPDCGQGQRRAF